MALPPYTMGQINNLDFAPLENALGRAIQQRQFQQRNALDQARMGMEQERLGFERERMLREAAREPYQLRALETAAKLGESNLEYLPRQRQIEEEVKRANALLHRSHANYYDVMGGVAQRKVETGDYRAQTQRQKIVGDFMQKVGFNPTPDVWERENQPGGILYTTFGGPQPWEKRGAILAQMQQHQEELTNPGLSELRAKTRIKEEERLRIKTVEKNESLGEIVDSIGDTLGLMKGAPKGVFGPINSAGPVETFDRLNPLGGSGPNSRYSNLVIRNQIRSQLQQLNLFALTPKGQGTITNYERGLIAEINAKVESSPGEALNLMEDLFMRMSRRRDASGGMIDRLSGDQPVSTPRAAPQPQRPSAPSGQWGIRRLD